MINEEAWLDLFRKTPRSRRGALCEALAWRAKKALVQFRQAYPGLSAEEHVDLMSGLFIALVPPPAREAIVGVITPFLKFAGQDFQRAFGDRVLDSVLDHDGSSERPHPFADVDFATFLERMSVAVKSIHHHPVSDGEVLDQKQFHERLAAEMSEWAQIVFEKHCTCGEASEEQRRRMSARGQASVLDSAFGRAVLFKISYGQGYIPKPEAEQS